MVRNAIRIEKPCGLCGDPYLPRGNKASYCDACLGPAVETKWGTRWPHRNRLMRYRIGYPAWVELVARYDGACWICREAPGENVDHDHATGKVRGALCTGCNVRLAALDDKEWLAKASAYLMEGQIR